MLVILPLYWVLTIRLTWYSKTIKLSKNLDVSEKVMAFAQLNKSDETSSDMFYLQGNRFHLCVIMSGIY